MAEGEEEEEEKNIGGDENSSPYPVGFRFVPTDAELIEYYLLPRLQDRPHVPNDVVIDDYVYSCHPDDLLLKGKYKKRCQDNTWFFLSSRARKYEHGDRPSRSTDDGLGRWKASTGCTTEVTARGNVVYCHRVLNYYDGPSYKDEDKGKWLMRELTIPQYENKHDHNGDDDASKKKTLDKFVMCKIYLTKREEKKKKKKKKKDDDEAGTSGKREAEETSQETTKLKISKRQKGKRAVEAATPKQEAPQAGPSPAQSSYGGGGDVPARFGTTTTGYHHHHHHYGGTGPPMVYNPNTSMPPRPPMAYNPHTWMPPRPPMAFNNGQTPPFRPSPVAPPAYFDQPMTMPHLDPPAGHAFRPPRPMAAPSYPEMQRQPETEEMRARRVYQQHVHELTMRAMMQHQQSANAAYAQQQPPPPPPMIMPPPPYFGDGFNPQHARPSHWFLQSNYHQPVEAGQQVQRSYAVPDSGAATAAPAETEAAGRIGPTNEGTDVTGDCNNDEKKGGSEGRAAPADGDNTQT